MTDQIIYSMVRVGRTYPPNKRVLRPAAGLERTTEGVGSAALAVAHAGTGSARSPLADQRAHLAQRAAAQFLQLFQLGSNAGRLRSCIAASSST